MTVGKFASGEVVVRREILLGEVWFAFPTICVEDSEELLPLYVPTGASSVACWSYPATPGVRRPRCWHTRWS